MADAFLEDINLGDQIYWQNEEGYTPITHNKQYALDGTLHIQSFKKRQGRTMEIDLRWQSSETVYALYNLIEQDAQMTCSLPDERSFAVVWDMDSPLDAPPICKMADRRQNTANEHEVIARFIMV